MGRFKEQIKLHFVDTLGIITFQTPFFVFLENALSKISDLNSINARFYAIILSFLGLGKLISGGRDFSRKIFHITHKTNEKLQSFHDSIYLGIFNFIPFGSEPDIIQGIIGSMQEKATFQTLRLDFINIKNRDTEAIQKYMETTHPFHALTYGNKPKPPFYGTMVFIGKLINARSEEKQEFFE